VELELIPLLWNAVMNIPQLRCVTAMEGAVPSSILASYLLRAVPGIFNSSQVLPCFGCIRKDFRGQKKPFSREVSWQLQVEDVNTQDRM
jgi:hypothetical protein